MSILGSRLLKSIHGFNVIQKKPDRFINRKRAHKIILQVFDNNCEIVINNFVHFLKYLLIKHSIVVSF